MQGKLREKRKLVQSSIQEQAVFKTLAGRYKVDTNPIGKGVSSNVMSGVNIKTGKKVAVKKINLFL